MLKHLHLIALSLCLLLTGCGARSGSVSPPPNAPLTPNYLASIAPVYWPQKTITYRINGGGGNLPGINLRAATRAGINAWQPSLAGLREIREARDDETPNVTVEYVSLSQLGGLGGGELGRTDLDVDEVTQTIKSARIRLLNANGFLLQAPTKVAATACHEFGHGGIGIRGHAPTEGPIMYADVPSRAQVTLPDFNTARSIYTIHPAP